jgi:uncharacterized membrane protein
VNPRRVQRSALALAAAAVGVSGYLTVAHFTSPKLLACSGSGTIDCSRVTTSAQSQFLGIPVAVLGLAWSIAMVALCTPWAWRASASWIKGLRIALAVAGMLFVLWLVYAELFVIRAICMWCTAMHIITFALFVLLLPFGPHSDPDASEGDEITRSRPVHARPPGTPESK